MASILSLPRIPQGNFDQAKSAAKLALQHREAIKNGELSVFFLAFVLALAKDGFLDLVPIVGNALGVFITVYLFVFLWWKGKWKVRLVVAVLAFFDLIPGPNLLPMQTLFVWYAYHQAKQEAKKSKQELEKLGSASAEATTLEAQRYRMNRRMAEQEANSRMVPRTAANSRPVGQSQSQSMVPQASIESRQQTQAPRPMAPSLASNDGSYAGYNKGPDGMYDKKAMEAAHKTNERMGIANRMGMDEGRAAKMSLGLREKEYGGAANENNYQRAA